MANEKERSEYEIKHSWRVFEVQDDKFIFAGSHDTEREAQIWIVENGYRQRYYTIMHLQRKV